MSPGAGPRRQHKAAGIRVGVVLSLLAAAVAAATAAPASAAPPTGDGEGGLRLTRVSPAFRTPVDVAVTRGAPGALFVATRRGRIEIVRKRRARRRPFLSVTRLVKLGPEEGLLSFAFSPRFRRNGLFYVYFTNKAGNDVVVEYRRARRPPLRADYSSRRLVLVVRHPYTGGHNGGELAFGPDGFLYLSVGDGSTGGDAFGQAQDPGTLLGTLLRIDPRRVRTCHGRRVRRRARWRGVRCGARARAYTSPPGNPFRAAGGRPEVYALGFRNPFRYSFDSATGAISIGDVGEHCLEEIDYRLRGRARGADFGWSRFEGTGLFNADVVAADPIPPIHQYSHAGSSPCYGPPTEQTGAAVVMGYVVRDRRLAHQYGRLVYSDWVNGEIRSLIPTEAAAIDEGPTGVSIPGGGAISFGEGPARRIYVTTTSGAVYRLDPA